MEQEEPKKDTNVKATIDAVTGLVKAIPIYHDTLQPAAKQIGQSLETVTKTVNIALAPIKVLVWGYEKIEDFISKKVSEKLKNVPEGNITSPPPQVAGPAIEALRYTGHDESLRDLYANLLATAMDKTTIHKAHPAYVEIIKSMISDEAILMKAFVIKDTYPLIDLHSKFKERSKGYSVVFSNFSHLHRTVTLKRPDLIPMYLNNLCRLGILEIPSGIYMTAVDVYDSIENDVELDKLKEAILNLSDREIAFERKMLTLTSFGKQFVENIVNEKK